MTWNVCCLVLTLLSANVSDLSQTARFTHEAGYHEANPFAAPIVDGPAPSGEMVLGALTTISSLALESRNTTASNMVLAVWAVAHTWAVVGNAKQHSETPYLIVAPILTVSW